MRKRSVSPLEENVQCATNVCLLQHLRANAACISAACTDTMTRMRARLTTGNRAGRISYAQTPKLQPQRFELKRLGA